MRVGTKSLKITCEWMQQVALQESGFDGGIN